MNMNPQNMMFGILLGRDLEQLQKLLLGLTASMLPANNPLGVFLLKPQADALVAKDAEIATLRGQIANTSAVDGFFNDAWFAPRDLVAGTPDESPVFPGTGDLTVESSPPGAVSATWNPTTRKVTIARAAGVPAPEEDVHVFVTVKYGDRARTALRTLKQ